MQPMNGCHMAEGSPGQFQKLLAHRFREIQMITSPPTVPYPFVTLLCCPGAFYQASTS